MTTTLPPRVAQVRPLTAAQQDLRLLLSRLDRPASIAELSERTGRHPNSVRELLGALVEAGYARRQPLTTHARGRRAWGYSIVGPASAEEASHHLAALSDALAAVLEGVPDATSRAYAVGHAWGEQSRADGDAARDPMDVVCAGLGRLGYEPEVVAPDRLELFTCALAVDPRGPRPLVCELHRGLIDGLLGRDDTELRPQVRPGVCAVRLPGADGPTPLPDPTFPAAPAADACAGRRR